VHLLGFIVRIYHDARSSECQKPISCVINSLGDFRFRSHMYGHYVKKSVLISFFQDLVMLTKSMEQSSFSDADCRSAGALQSFQVQRVCTLS
jgi:hypothetical protein